jgi:phage FluMu gp28-like protein
MTQDPEQRARALLRHPWQAKVLDRYKPLPAAEFLALCAWLATFYRFQLLWLLEDTLHAIMNKGRQIGLSHTSAACAVLWAVFRGEPVVVLSKNESDSLDVLEKCRGHVELLTRFGSRMARTVRDKNEKLNFASGGWIWAKPSTGGRGQTANLILDEFAHHKDQKSVIANSAAATTHGGYRIRITSTPNGTGDEFHRFCERAIPSADVERPTRKYILHRIPMADAIADGMRVDLDDCLEKVGGDPRLFAQEYECAFLDGSQQYIATGYVARALVDNLYVVPNCGEWYAGLDIGKEHDLTALVVLHYDGMKATTRAIRTCKRTSSEDLHALVAHAFSTYPLRRLCVDQTTIGEFPTQEMQRRYGMHAVEGVKFTSQSKDVLATTLYSALADNWVRLPARDECLLDIDHGSAKGLRDDICRIKRIIMPGGGIRYDAASNSDGHADRAWALALALYGITNRPTGKHVHFAGRSEQ